MRRWLVAGAAPLALLVATWLVVRELTAPTEGQAVAVTSAPETDASVRSDALKFSFFDQAKNLPDLRFIDGDGSSLSLQDFRGKPIILNIWATWCVPCRQEMPALDRLQAKLGASQLLVLPLSIDRQGMPVVTKFYRELGLVSLGIYLDQTGQASGELNAVGLPTTLLVDRIGREIARKIGPAEWDSPEVVELLRTRLGLAPPQEKASR